jgi:hypothetical protein
MPILLAGVFRGKVRSEWLFPAVTYSTPPAGADHTAHSKWLLLRPSIAMRADPACVDGGLRLYCAPLARWSKKIWAWCYSFSD